MGMVGFVAEGFLRNGYRGWATHLQNRDEWRGPRAEENPLPDFDE